MMKTLVTDLEHVLIAGIRQSSVNPHSETMLERARDEFDQTLLWSMCKLKDIEPRIQELDWWKYFDGIIGLEYNLHAIYSGRLDPSGDYSRLGHAMRLKDLRLLGEPEDYVILDDMPLLCRPKQRSIKVFPFVGYNDNRLMHYYQRAIDMFKDNGHDNQVQDS